MSCISERLKVGISYKEFLYANTPEKLAKLIENGKSKKQKYEYPKYSHTTGDEYEEFPLTDVQMAYLLGRNDEFDLGGISTHGYYEVLTKLDIKKLEKTSKKVSAPSSKAEKNKVKNTRTKSSTKRTAKIIAQLVKEGAEVVISHSNAPQVGMIHMAMNEFGKYHPDYTYAPMSVCSAMSQGYIGYDLQNAIRAELMKEGIYKPVSTILTQVTVDTYDEAFAEHVKVIGRVLNEQEAEEEENKGNYVTKIGDGYRRIVAAPKPQKIVEIDAIRALLDAGQIVIACGGGGIPVLEQGTELKGASAVIEKDYTSGRLAEQLDADELLILTSVEKVSVNFHKQDEEELGEISVAQAKEYMAEGQFEANTMLPKIQASVEFVEQGEGKKAVITSIDKAVDAYLGRTGTVIC